MGENKNNTKKMEKNRLRQQKIEKAKPLLKSIAGVCSILLTSAFGATMAFLLFSVNHNPIEFGMGLGMAGFGLYASYGQIQDERKLKQNKNDDYEEFLENDKMSDEDVIHCRSFEVNDDEVKVYEPYKNFNNEDEENNKE